MKPSLRNIILQQQNYVNIPLTFSRPGVRYDNLGNQYAANVPVVNANGTLVEEGTSNIVPEGLSISFTEAWTSGTLNGTYTVSINGATGSLTLSGGATGTVNAGSTLTFTVTNSTVTFTPTGTPALSQLENKAYKTTWHMGGGTRNDELLTIPPKVFNLTEWTIELEIYVNSHFEDNIGNRYLFDAAVDGTHNRLTLYRGTDGKWAITTYNTAGTTQTLLKTDSSAIGTSRRLTVTGDASSINFYINGSASGIPSLTNPPIPQVQPVTFSIGSRFNGIAIGGVYIKNLMILNRKLSPAEAANRGVTSNFVLNKSTLLGSTLRDGLFGRGVRYPN